MIIHDPIVKTCTTAAVPQVYGMYSPFEFLVYWHELWRSYESAYGPFTAMPARLYTAFTGVNMRKRHAEGAAGQAVAHAGAGGQDVLVEQGGGEAS